MFHIPAHLNVAAPAGQINFNKPAPALLYMVCYRTGPNSQSVYHSTTPEGATYQARAAGLFKPGVIHLWTVPYNYARMTPEQSYAAYLAKGGLPARTTH